MSAYKKHAQQRPKPVKEALNIRATDAKLKTSKPAATKNGEPKNSTVYVTTGVNLDD